MIMADLDGINRHD